nr:MAG TPA: hypothetical protein [Caudoviricetes sp.]
MYYSVLSCSTYLCILVYTRCTTVYTVVKRDISPLVHSRTLVVYCSTILVD